MRTDVELRGSCRGFAMIEVIAALVLCAVLTGVLAECLIGVGRRADSVQKQASAVGVKNVGNPAEEAWSWGPIVLSGSWSLGPELTLELRATGRDSRFLGIWCDGWFQGEVPVSGTGQVSLGVAEWVERTAAEVVIRVREGGNGWGPPWRTTVPAADGKVAPEEPQPSVESSEAAIHLPTAGAAGIRVSPAEQVLQQAIGFPSVLSSSASGDHWASFGGSKQTWHAESGRVLDIYF